MDAPQGYYGGYDDRKNIIIAYLHFTQSKLFDKISERQS